ncbi:NADH-quinone oxidoreductase subunit A [Sodalis-like secondary symbiont of Drepanosiphum platanoidis]|uniref:NADH-quinone oxidoreductase subunit A n=1 Tax=Sodalis-like secondary symbiont of Drepanosiphum platanoidis TaxID=2994493 RepID=UPI003464C1EA
MLISNQLLSFIFFSLGTFFISIIMILISYFLGGKSESISKNIPFESGISSADHICLKFSIKFYLIAIFFVIFDVESLYLYIWTVSIKEVGWIGFIQIIIYIFIMLISLLYIIKSNLMNWTKKNIL